MTRFRLKIWGLVGLSVVIGAAACGGRKIHDVGTILDGEAGTTAGNHDHPGTGGAGTAGAHPGVGGTGVLPGGTGGTGADAGLGEGGIDPNPDGVDHLTCPTCVALTTTENVTALAATADEVFWSEHGGYDELLNYQGDGRLMAMPAMGGKPRVVADELQGPVELELSQGYFYLLVDESTASDGKLQLVRVPRSGGAAENIQAPLRGSHLRWMDRQLAAGSDHVAWFNADQHAVYTLAEAPGAKPEVLLQADGVTDMFGENALLYVLDEHGLTTVPYAGGERTTLSNFDNGDAFSAHYSSFTVVGDFIYALEFFADRHNAAAGYLARMPKTGGPWKRLAGFPTSSDRLVIAGGQLTISAASEYEQNERRLQQGSLDAPNALQVVVKAPRDPDSAWGVQFHLWDFSSAGLFFADGGQLYRAPLAR